MDEPVGPHTGHRGHVHDAPALAVGQRGQGGHRHGPRGEDVDLEDAAPDVDGGRRDVVVRNHGGGPRIVHQRVETAPALEGGGHQALGDVGFGDVALDVEGVGQRGGHGLAGLDRAGRVDEHGRPEPGEGAGAGLADAARGAGDEDGLSRQREVGGRRLRPVIGG